MKSKSYILSILRILRASGKITVSELAAHLYEEIKSQNVLPNNWKNWEDVRFGIISPLNELLELGILSPNRGMPIGPDSNVILPPAPPSDFGGGQDGDGRDGGNGLEEVLAHPFLFSYDEDTFEELLERTLRKFNV